MAAVLFKVFKGKAEDMPSTLHDGYVYFATDTGKFYIDSRDDSTGFIRRNLINPDARPGGAISNTTEGWNADPSFVSEKDMIYVYTDYQQDSQGNNIPGIKIGDGNAYLIDLPFMDSIMMDHINDRTIHIT